MRTNIEVLTDGRYPVEFTEHKPIDDDGQEHEAVVDNVMHVILVWGGLAPNRRGAVIYGARLKAAEHLVRGLPDVAR